MPITPFINGHRFDPEDRRVLGVAFEMVCIALRVGDCDDGVKRAIAAKIIDLAKAGEHKSAAHPRTFRPQSKESPAEAGLRSSKHVLRVKQLRTSSTRHSPELLLLLCRGRARCRPKEPTTVETHCPVASGGAGCRRRVGQRDARGAVHGAHENPHPHRHRVGLAHVLLFRPRVMLTTIPPR